MQISFLKEKFSSIVVYQLVECRISLATLVTMDLSDNALGPQCKIRTSVDRTRIYTYRDTVTSILNSGFRF